MSRYRQNNSKGASERRDARSADFLFDRQKTPRSSRPRSRFQISDAAPSRSSANSHPHHQKRDATLRAPRSYGARIGRKYVPTQSAQRSPTCVAPASDVREPELV